MRVLSNLKVVSFTLLFTLIGVGCAGTIRPTQSIETARLAIGEANRNEAAIYAPTELGVAREKLTAAEQESRVEHNTLARRLAEQAGVDARYAQVRAQAEKAQIAATENRDTTETIQGIR